MRKTACSLVVVAGIVLSGTGLKAEPPAKTDRKSNSTEAKKTTKRDSALASIIESANGWTYANGQWVHPDGYKLVNNKVVRTTAKAGKTFPSPPGKLALENPTKLTPRSKAAAPRSSPQPQTEAEKAAEARRRNLTPTPASQTGTHL